MAEQTNNNILGDISPDRSTFGEGAFARSAKSPATPVEQRFDPMTGNEIAPGNGEDKGLIHQVKSTASEAYGTATAKATEKLEEQKSNLSGGLSNVATNVRQLGDNLGTSGSNDQIAKLTSEFSTAAAEKIERAANYFDQKDLKAMYHDVETLARNNPALFIGGAFALGFLAARFFKSSGPKQFTRAAGEPFHVPEKRPQMGGSAARGI